MASDAPRFAPLTMENLSDAQRPLAEHVLKLTRRGLGGPFPVMLRSPGMAAGMIELFDYYRLRSKLEPRLKELAILILAREWSAHYEWFAHRPLAVQAGLSEATIADLRLGRRPMLRTEEAIVYELVMALVRDHAVDDENFARARQLLGEEQLVDLVSMVGEYMKVALLLALGRVGVPNGEELPPLQEGDEE